MDMSKIALLCGDDIYYEDHECTINPIFRPKGKNNYGTIC